MADELIRLDTTIIGIEGEKMRLIDRQAVRMLESDADAYTEDWNGDYEKGFCDAICKVLELPTVETEPVKHGRWVPCGDYAKCSICNGSSGTQFDGVEPAPRFTAYCPNCGARMDLKDGDGT